MPIALRAGVFAVLAVVGCSSLPTETPRAATPVATALASPSTAPPPAETHSALIELPPAGTLLEAGRYTNSSFSPRVTFEIGPGWTAAQALPGFFDIQDDPGSLDVIAVQFANVVRAESAAEAAQSIEDRPNVSVRGFEQLTIGDYRGVRLVAETTDPADRPTPIFRPVLDSRPGALSIASGRRLQVNLLDVDGAVLAILVGGSIAEWGRTMEVATPILDSITIGQQPDK